MKWSVNASPVVAIQRKHQGRIVPQGQGIQVRGLKVRELGELCRRLEALSCHKHGVSSAQCNLKRPLELPPSTRGLPSLKLNGLAQGMSMTGAGEPATQTLGGTPQRFSPSKHLGSQSTVCTQNRASRNSLSTTKLGDTFPQLSLHSQPVSLDHLASVQQSGGHSVPDVSGRVVHAAYIRGAEMQGESIDSQPCLSNKVQSMTPEVSEVQLPREQRNECGADSERFYSSSRSQDSFSEEEGGAEQPILNLSLDASRGGFATVQVSIEDEAKRVDLSRLEVDMKECLGSDGMSGVEVITHRQGDRVVVGGAHGGC